MRSEVQIQTKSPSILNTLNTVQYKIMFNSSLVVD